MVNNQKSYYIVKEVSEILNLSIVTVRRYIQSQNNTRFLQAR